MDHENDFYRLGGRRGPAPFLRGDRHRQPAFEPLGRLVVPVERPAPRRRERGELLGPYLLVLVAVACGSYLAGVVRLLGPWGAP